MNRAFKSLLVSLLLFTALITPALAFKLQKGKWASFPRYYLIQAQVYVNEINTAANSWNNAGTKAKLYRTTTDGYETILITPADFGGTDWDALSTYYPSRDAIPRNYVQIRLNTFFMNGYNFQQRQHVTAHEMGHAIGLAHEDGVNCVLMNSGGFCAVTPKQDDINGVKAKYP